MMDLTQIKFLNGLVSSGPCEKTTSLSAEHFHSTNGMGHRMGRTRFEYSEKDIQYAKSLLLAHGITPDQLLNKASDRADACITGVSEKAGTKSIRGDDVVLKPLTPGCLLGGTLLPVGLPGHLVMPHADAAAIDADGILVVENLETVNQIHRYRWIFDHECAKLRVFVLFRGDSVNKADAAIKVLEARNDPVWSFPDFDPAGLGFASKLPRLQGLVLPWEEIEAITRKRQLTHLYDKNVGQWGNTLDALDRPDFKKAWALMKSLKLGLNQEALRSH
jgi:hypothetical protein